MTKPTRNFDPECRKLAEYFLEETGARISAEDIDCLAQCIQDRIEDWLSDYDQKQIDAEESAREGKVGEVNPNCYKTYLGDGAYIELSDVEPGGVWLTTSDGTQDTNAVYLEPGVLQAFLDYVKRIPEMEHERAIAHAEMVEDRRFEGYNEQ